MNEDCRTYENAWNELLDARGAADIELIRSLEAHAAVCQRCAALATGYRRLQKAVPAWRAQPIPTIDLADRVRSAWSAETVNSFPFRQRHPRAFVWVMTAAAASIAAIGWIDLHHRLGPAQNRPVGQGPALSISPKVATAAAPPSRLLSDSIGNASRATLVLARSATEPAVRVGWQVLSSAELSETAPTLPVGLPEGNTSTPEALQAVGDDVARGVGPLSGSARKAFGFLLGPAIGPSSASPPGRGA